MELNTSSRSSKVDVYLMVVGKISAAYRSITANVPEIPHLPIMLNVILTGISEVSPANEKQRNTMRIPTSAAITEYQPISATNSVHADDRFSAQQHNAIAR